MKKILLLSVALIGVAAGLFAGFWDWSTPYQGPDKDVITLVITGNYRKPRAMAELIQAENSQPFILLPYQGAKGIFFCPRGPNAQALEIQADQFAQFVVFLNPKRIIILGDDRYVPIEYRQLLEYNGFSPVTFSGNWDKVANDVAQLLRLQRLPDNFRRVVKETTGNHIPGQGRDMQDVGTVIAIDNK